MKKTTADILQIRWIDRSALEAEVIFLINGLELCAFSHPCNFQEGECTEVKLDLIIEEIPESVFWYENKEARKALIPSERNVWRYYCYGQLMEIQPGIVDCGAVSFQIGNLACDQSVIGSYVYFVISRLDITKSPSLPWKCASSLN
jgi:hypothetical protein